MNRLLFSGALALSALTMGMFGLAPGAHAASYGSFSSPTGTVSFLDVEDLNGLFGTPMASGNSLDFSPNTFEIDCPNASQNCPTSTASISDTLTFQIDADNGYFIENIIMTEAGDTQIEDFAIATGFAATTVVANVFIDILELDGVSVSGINANAAMVFTADGSFATDVEGSGNYVWDGLLSLDVNQVIANAGGIGNATLVEISLANTLTAYAENGALAFIEKKDIDGLAITVVPEPGPAILMGLGLAGLTAVSRRRPV